MDLGLRDWMIIIGVLLIVVVLIDGYRRVRIERRGKIRMALNKQFLNTTDSEEDRSSELPNGGARVVRQRSTPSLGDGELDLDQTVPMLMESVVENNTSNYMEANGLEQEADDPAHKHTSGDDQPANDFSATDTGHNTDEALDETGDITAVDDKDMVDVLMDEQLPRNRQKNTAQTKKHQVAAEQEVLVINVAAKGDYFKGTDLLHILLACDLRFGDMNIFHRYERENGSGAVQFSMANSVEPGTFDLDNIDDFTTPGVCFFMSVPGPEESIKAFEYMVETAQCLVSNLNGEMQDETRSVMTRQTLEHCRQRLRDFERRRLTQPA